jgi:hypothetical protein
MAGDPYPLYGIANTTYARNTFEENKRRFEGIEARLSKIERRLLILHPNEELHVQYPALKEAYDHYLLMEKLIDENNR